jgi:hypothetical protein
MNRPLLIAAFVLLLPAVPLLAQHGGGGHAGGGGGHAGFAGHSGFSGGGHAIGGVRSGSFAGRSSAFARGSFSGIGRNRSGVGLRLRSYGYGGCAGRYGCGYGAWGYYPYLGGGVDPYWWWNDDSNAGADQGAPYGYDNGLANEMQDQGIPTRPAPDASNDDYYARSAPPTPPQQESAQAVSATVLVFRDQHQQEVQNYAIVGPMLWSFTSQRTQKIPLSDLDLAATQKANDERGVDFHLPTANEGQ